MAGAEYSYLRVTSTICSTTSTYVGSYEGKYYYSCPEPTFKVKETVKQRRIREAQAFKCFQKNKSFTPIAKQVFVKAENIESNKRIDKFRSKNNNLIGMEFKPIFR